MVAKALEVKPAHCQYALASYIEKCWAKYQLAGDSSGQQAKTKVTASNRTREKLMQLTYDANLAIQAEMSLEQRVATFNRDHADQSLFKTRLRDIYRLQGTKKKFVECRLILTR